MSGILRYLMLIPKMLELMLTSHPRVTMFFASLAGAEMIFGSFHPALFSLGALLSSMCAIGIGAGTFPGSGRRFGDSLCLILPALLVYAIVLLSPNQQAASSVLRSYPVAGVMLWAVVILAATMVGLILRQRTRTR